MEQADPRRWLGVSGAEVPDHLTQDEVAQIIQAAPPGRDRLFCLTLAQTGGRISEVLSLRAGWVGDKYLYLPTLKRKVRPPPSRKIFVPPELCGVLQQWIALNQLAPGDLLFVSRAGTPWSRSKAWARFKAIARAAGVERMGKGGMVVAAWPHLLRHTAAVNWLRRTGIVQFVQQQLGHKDVQSTVIYANLTTEDRERIFDETIARDAPVAGRRQPRAGHHRPAAR